MAVYFVYRSPYEGPSGKHLKRFPDDDTVLDWFRNSWRFLGWGEGEPPAGEGKPARVRRRRAGREAVDRLSDTLGCDVYGFGTLFERAAEHDLPPPASDRQLDEYLQQYLYSEGPILYRPHLLTVKTDDDELELAYHFFDDHYLARHGKRAAFLLHDGWQLPGGHGKAGFRASEPTSELKPAGKGEGTTYLIFHAFYDSSNLIDLPGGYRIKGARVPDLARYLARVRPPEDWPLELLLLRSQLLAEPRGATAAERAFLREVLADPRDDATWLVYSDWLEEHGLPRAGRVVLERALRAVSHYPPDRLSYEDAGPSKLATATVGEAREVVERAADNPWPRLTYDPKKSLVHVEDHLAQLCLHTDRWDGVDLYHQWFLFDDLWAGAHPDLATALLRYARTWDVLSPGRPAEED
jgi:uncharacterized protein (TIGR02996 family)